MIVTPQPQFSKYAIMADGTASSLADSVACFMAKGWIPMGGVSVCARTGNIYQAMALPIVRTPT